MTDNLHPVDELFRLRADKGAIENRIEELRAMIIDMPPAERVGREARATVTAKERQKLDLERVRYDMGQRWIDERSTSQAFNIVKVNRL